MRFKLMQIYYVGRLFPSVNLKLLIVKNLNSSKPWQCIHVYYNSWWSHPSLAVNVGCSFQQTKSLEDTLFSVSWINYNMYCLSFKVILIFFYLYCSIILLRSLTIKGHNFTYCWQWVFFNSRSISSYWVHVVEKSRSG